jgi:hypothetical protein
VKLGCGEDKNYILFTLLEELLDAAPHLDVKIFDQIST